MTETIQTIKTLTGHTDFVRALSVLPDGSLASGSEDKTIKIWDVRNGQTIKTLTGHTSYVYALSVLSDGSLASGSSDSTVKIWDLKNGQTIKTLTGHTDDVDVLTILPDCSLVSVVCPALPVANTLLISPFRSLNRSFRYHYFVENRYAKFF